MNDQDQTSIHKPMGDGGSAKVAPADLKRLQQELDSLASGYKAAADRRKDNEDTRLNRWSGQSKDGRKRKKTMGKEPWPFEGASDSRLRVADEIINIQTAILKQAATRMVPAVVGMESNDNELGARLATVLKYEIKHSLRNEYSREIERLVQWALTDGSAALYVSWSRQLRLCNRTVRAADLIELYQQITGAEELEEFDLASLESLIADTEREDEAIAFLKQLDASGTTSDKRAKKMLAELRQYAETTFPYPTIKSNRPKIQALRYNENLFIPGNTRDIENARAAYVVEHVSESELRGMEHDRDFDPKFIEKAMATKGKCKFLDGTNSARSKPTYTAGDGWVENSTGTDNAADLIEIVTCFYHGSNDKGIPGIYVLPFCPGVPDMAATERDLIEYEHGELPFHNFSREHMTNRLLESRGIPEICEADQAQLKALTDSTVDHAQISTIPPILAPVSRPKLDIAIGPGKPIKYELDKNEIGYMDMPPYPASAMAQQDAIERRVAKYFGLRHKDVNELDVTQLAQKLVNDLLDCLRLALRHVLQLVQQYRDDNDLSRIAGGKNGMALPRTRDEIQGMFDIDLSFDARDIDKTYLIEFAKTVAQIIAPLDQNSTLIREELLNWLLRSFNPNLAENVVRPVQVANEAEREAERNAIAQVNAGLQPDLPREGQDAMARMDVWRGLMSIPESRANILADPLKRAIALARMKGFQGQLMQIRNAQTGRNMTEGAPQFQDIPGKDLVDLLEGAAAVAPKPISGSAGEVPAAPA